VLVWYCTGIGMVSEFGMDIVQTIAMSIIAPREET